MKIHNVCYCLASILVVGFFIKSIVNYFQYDPIATSAPFYLWLIINAFYFLVPALMIFIVGLIEKAFSKNNGTRE